jgi:hypothetical protein
LVGVDGCLKTLEKLKTISYKYNNLKIYLMDSNKGCYITINTLLSLTKSDDVIIFNGDDIMLPNMISDIMLSDGLFKRFQYYTYYSENKIMNNTHHAHGVSYLHKSILKELGGYKPWVCSADTDFMRRLALLNIKETLIDKKLFYYRIHPKSLTQRKSTKMGTLIRSEYELLMSKNNKSNCYVDPIINTYVEIF